MTAFLGTSLAVLLRKQRHTKYIAFQAVLFLTNPCMNKVLPLPGSIYLLLRTCPAILDYVSRHTSHRILRECPTKERGKTSSK